MPEVRPYLPTPLSPALLLTSKNTVRGRYYHLTGAPSKLNRVRIEFLMMSVRVIESSHFQPLTSRLSIAP